MHLELVVEGASPYRVAASIARTARAVDPCTGCFASRKSSLPASFFCNVFRCTFAPMGRVQRAILRCLRDGVALTTRELTVGVYNRWTPTGASAVRRALVGLKQDRIASKNGRRWHLHKSHGQTRSRRKLKPTARRAKQGRDELPGQKDFDLRGGTLVAPRGGIKWDRERES